MSKGYTHITFKQVVEVSRLLETAVTPVPTTDGTRKCRYNDGYSDASIAEQFNVSKASIAKVRQDVYGNLFREPKEQPVAAPSRDELAQGLRELEEKNLVLTDKFNTLLDRFNKLVNTLALNRVADVKHLGVKEETSQESAKAAA